MKKTIIKTVAFVTYLIFIILFYLFKLGGLNQFIQTILFLISVPLGIIIFHSELYEWRNIERETENKNTIFKEIILYIPVLLLQITMATYIKGNKLTNEIVVIDLTMLLMQFIVSVVIVPIYEEVIFRYIPYFIFENSFLYTIITGFIFAFLHVADLGIMWPFYIWSYLINSIYYSYRYSQTGDLRVTIALHRINNFVSLLLMIFAIRI